MESAIGELNRQKEAELATCSLAAGVGRVVPAPVARGAILLLKVRSGNSWAERRMAELEVPEPDPAAAGKPIQHSGLQMTCTMSDGGAGRTWRVLNDA